MQLTWRNLILLVVLLETVAMTSMAARSKMTPPWLAQAQVGTPTSDAAFVPMNTNTEPASPMEQPTVAPVGNEALRLTLPVVAILVFCVLGWYARRCQRRPFAEDDEKMTKDQ